MSSAGFGHFGCVLDYSRPSLKDVDAGGRCLRQGVGQDPEASDTGRVINDDLLAVGIDVRIMADLVSIRVAKVGRRLVGRYVTESRLAEFILRMEFGNNR